MIYSLYQSKQRKVMLTKPDDLNEMDFLYNSNSCLRNIYILTWIFGYCVISRIDNVIFHILNSSEVLILAHITIDEYFTMEIYF